MMGIRMTLLLVVHGRGGVGRHDFRVQFRLWSVVRIRWNLPVGWLPARKSGGEVCSAMLLSD
jgi:hypothetical protein